MTRSSTASSTALAGIIEQVQALDEAAVAAARERQDRLTKPRGALGVLEEVSIRLCGLAGTCPAPVPARAAVAVFAGDHGVHAQAVSPWPQEVRVVVVDGGVATPVAAGPELRSRRVRPGTGDFTSTVAMTREQAVAALEVGIEIARLLVEDGHDCLITGDMGIANTTPSAALIAAFTGTEVAQVTGRGTGVDEATWRRKVDVVRRGLELHADAVAAVAADPIGVLAAVGLEHAAIAGFVLAGAALRVPVLLDGVIAGAAALVSQALAPLSIQACFAGHRSVEPGHTVALDRLGLRPLVDLDLRLGEGTGAVLSLPLVQAAARALQDMATFDSAGVVEKDAGV